MSRFILRFKGRGAKPDSDVAHIRSLPGVAVLDDSSPRMLLVQASSQTADHLVESFPDWTLIPERSLPLPDPRRKIRPS